ncbi:MAG: UDP-3-O-[3-hydroxymyristoyl] glucosamine N-acyltransferase [Maribacter sp.]|jgi:UDP-3-O-[3-hydroxymyristoyl] glucosamine N-acyltransferase
MMKYRKDFIQLHFENRFYMQITAAQLCQLLKGEIIGNPEVLVKQPGKIEEAIKGDITFLANPKYESFAYTTSASVILVSREFQPKQPISATMIRVDDVYASITFLLNQFGGKVEAKEGVSPNAFVHDTVSIEKGVSVGHFSTIEEGAEIGEGTIIFPQVFIGKNVKIGRNCILYPGVKIHKDCVIGNRCFLNANVVIGSDGFGFVPQKDGSYQKVAQTGNVIIEDNVEIGANSAIDRATMGSTVIRQGAKLDNLVMVAHNVEIGANTVVAAQAGFAGSSKIGNNCMIGGQSGFVGHINVANGTKVQAQSGVNKSINEDNTAWYGSPILPYKDYLRSYAAFRKLPALMKRIFALEKQLKNKE